MKTIPRKKRRPTKQAPTVTESTTGRSWFRTTTEFLARHRQQPHDVMGIHLHLRGACAARLNGGRFEGARKWPDRDWLLAAGVDRGNVDAVVASGLARWEAQALVVLDYDGGLEEVYIARVRSVAEARDAKAGRTRKTDTNGSNQPLKSEVEINGCNQPLISEDDYSREGEGDPDLDPEEERKKRGGDPELARPSLALSDPDRPRSLNAIRVGYRAARGGELPPQDLRDVDRAVAALAKVADPEVAAEVVRRFYSSDGPRDGDPYWCKHHWPIRLIYQAVEAFAADAEEVVGDRQRAAAQRQFEDQRRAAKAAAQAAADQRAVEELAALPPVMRSWREAVNAISARRPRVGAILATADVVEGAGGLAVTIRARDQGSVSGCWAEIEADFAARAPGVGLQLLSDELETVRDAAHV